MKKRLLLAILVPGLCLCAFARENKMSIGMGAEWNMASRHNFAGGATVNFIHDLPGSSALGLSFRGSWNFNAIYVLEPAFLIRHYFSQDTNSGFFLQFDVGAFIALEEQGITPMIMSGLGAGFRLPLGKSKSFYIEPCGRLGYPFAFGLGAMAGFRF
jgi:hypothetical protein